jgi:hypothetical protein
VAELLAEAEHEHVHEVAHEPFERRLPRVQHLVEHGTADDAAAIPGQAAEQRELPGGE